MTTEGHKAVSPMSNRDAVAFVYIQHIVWKTYGIG